MEIHHDLAQAAIEEAYGKFPTMREYSPTLVWRPLAQGGALMLSYDAPPPRNHPDAWEFQNAVVRAYKRLAGV